MIHVLNDELSGHAVIPFRMDFSILLIAHTLIQTDSPEEAAVVKRARGTRGS